MNIIFIGSVEFSLKALKKIVELNVPLTGVITKEESAFNADHVNLEPFCKENGIEVLTTRDINSEEVRQWMTEREPDAIFCCGWSNILKKEVLRIPKIGVIGFHPSKLPYNRGRHPIVWALVLGLEMTASTFFFMDEGIDSGDIINQIDVPIYYEDDARHLYDRITTYAMQQIEMIINDIKNDSIKRMPQNHSQTNHWRKRREKDGEIDFRMSKRAIYNLVRALTRPYIGAHILYMGEKVNVWKVEEMEWGECNIEYGRVLAVKGRSVTVKCYDGAVRIVEHSFGNLPGVGDFLL